MWDMVTLNVRLDDNTERMLEELETHQRAQLIKTLGGTVEISRSVIIRALIAQAHRDMTRGRKR